jgi:hypothetical protein
MANLSEIWRNQEKKRKHIIEVVLVSLPYEKLNFEVLGSSNAETASANARFCSVQISILEQNNGVVLRNFGDKNVFSQKYDKIRSFEKKFYFRLSL